MIFVVDKIKSKIGWACEYCIVHTLEEAFWLQPECKKHVFNQKHFIKMLKDEDLLHDLSSSTPSNEQL